MAIELKRMVQLRGSPADWAVADPVLLEGEVALEQDANRPRLKIGDGVRTYSQLPYLGQSSDETGFVVSMQGGLDQEEYEFQLPFPMRFEAGGAGCFAMAQNPPTNLWTYSLFVLPKTGVTRLPLATATWQPNARLGSVNLPAQVIADRGDIIRVEGLPLADPIGKRFRITLRAMKE
jgi:hypothetical protein